MINIYFIKLIILWIWNLIFIRFLLTLAFALIATLEWKIPITFENVLAQKGVFIPESSVNDTISGQNASQWSNNVTLVFTQEDNTGMTIGEDMSGQNKTQGNETGLIYNQSDESKNDENNERDNE